MLSTEHFATGCYQHNTRISDGTTLFFDHFHGGDWVIQGGAGGRGNALFVGGMCRRTALRGSGLVREGVMLLT